MKHVCTIISKRSAVPMLYYDQGYNVLWLVNYAKDVPYRLIDLVDVFFLVL